MTTPQTLLIVDDDPGLRGLVRMTLEPQGYRVLEAGDPTEANHHLVSEPIRLVLLDLDLGDSGDAGLELCAAVAGSVSSPCVIMVTGSGDPEDRQACLEAGATAFLTKPYSPLELADLVALHMRDS